MKRILLIIFSFSFINLGYADPNPEAGKQKSEVCAACHGPDGNSIMPAWPKIAGQHAGYIVKQMQIFKKGKDGGRYNENMTPMMQNLSTQDMQDLAAYFSKQTLKVGEVDKKHLERGQALYRGGDIKKGISACIACHGPQGIGNESANFPSISGQHVEYTIAQLQAYKDGQRKGDALSDIMVAIAQRMDKSDMEAVANYIHGLH